MIFPVDATSVLPLELCEPKRQGQGPNQHPALFQGQDQPWVFRVGQVKGLCNWPLTVQSPPTHGNPSPSGWLLTWTPEILHFQDALDNIQLLPRPEKSPLHPPRVSQVSG